jgi:hypothetical protein
MMHCRFSGIGRPTDGIFADIIRFENGVLQERWDVTEDEARKSQSVSGPPVFSDQFRS